MPAVPRVAFFTHTFTETNGVALTSRKLTEFAARRGYPMLCVRGGTETAQSRSGSLISQEVARGMFSITLDRGLLYDPMLVRHQRIIAKAVAQFQPDIIHIVSPGDVSQLGLWLARRMSKAQAISWHTNLHEFGAARAGKMLGWLGHRRSQVFTGTIERQCLRGLLAFYRLGDVLYAPNDELTELLTSGTGKPAHLMKRGIDASLFTPARRGSVDGILRIGYVGRVTPEKNVRFLKDLETALRAAGAPPFRFLIVGDGSERGWLERNLIAADLPGILRGEALADAYASMDVFAFPSRTDTFGNVVLEAFASGVPAVVTNAGGPKFIVQHGASGYIAGSDSEFIEATLRLLTDEALRLKMANLARAQACGESWDDVFEKVYDGYREGIAARESKTAAAVAVRR